eukprot:TRINITY_DN4984_c0_g3_i1.p1 TRINITY_DN4984_c0_g3~~TRINITY_DN4984_c0_g3_i1.p1  ORF type:complete len:450 (-),score=105.13 TRINITY_DN4984_c0_g3_i1:1125-2474(-)
MAHAKRKADSAFEKGDDSVEVSFTEAPYSDEDEPSKTRHWTSRREVKTDAQADSAEPPSTESRPKLYPKKKIAMLFAYNGEGYQGLQMNSGVRTIEEDIEKALFEAGAITPSNYGDLHKIGWQRAARTDKGVSALGQVASFKCILLPDVIDRINEKLPEQIRVLDYTRITGGFNSKNNCDGRKYSYLLPTFGFAPSHSGSKLENIPYAPRYQFDHNTLMRVRYFLKRFVGTHNFHNYTIDKKPSDPSAMRVIRSFECSDPFQLDGMEVVLMTVIGQSFMLHQIRKMIGTVISVVRGDITEGIFAETLTPAVIRTPMAPGVGLFLERCYYKGYEAKYRDKAPLFDDEKVEPMKTAFRDKYIFPHIIQSEKRKYVVANWLRHIDLHPMGENDDQISAEERGRLTEIHKERLERKAEETRLANEAKRARLSSKQEPPKASSFLDYVPQCIIS